MSGTIIKISKRKRLAFKIKKAYNLGSRKNIHAPFSIANDLLFLSAYLLLMSLILPVVALSLLFSIPLVPFIRGFEEQKREHPEKTIAKSIKLK